MFIKKSIILLLSISFFISQTAFAHESATNTISGISLDSFLDVGNFDAAYYAANYPEVAASFGNDAESLLSHYIQYGYDQGLNATGKNVATTAKIIAYRTAHEITNDNMSTYDKVKVVHDWIITHTVYDYDRYIHNTAPTTSYYIAGVMLYNTGVCSGYADTFQFFMEVLGIDCCTITGTATTQNNVTGSHAWNQVCIDGIWYNIDLTWDDSLQDNSAVTYDYFLLSNQKIGNNHATNNWIHKCSQTYTS